MKRIEVDYALVVGWSHQIPAVVTPRLPDSDWLPVHLERDPVIIEAVSLNVRDTIHGSEDFEEGPKCHPGTGDLEAC